METRTELIAAATNQLMRRSPGAMIGGRQLAVQVVNAALDAQFDDEHLFASEYGMSAWHNQHKKAWAKEARDEWKRRNPDSGIWVRLLVGLISRTLIPILIDWLENRPDARHIMEG